MTRALRKLVALSAVSAVAAQLTTGFSFADEANTPSIIDAHAMHRRLQLTAQQTADVLCSASMYAEESCNKARSAAEAASPPPQIPGSDAPSPPPPPFGPRTESPSPPPAVQVFNPPPPPPVGPVTLLMAANGADTDYDINKLIDIRNRVAIAAGVENDAVTISSSGGLDAASGRRLAEKFGALTSTAVVLTCTIQPSATVPGTKVLENLSRSQVDGGLGRTVADVSKVFETIRHTSLGNQAMQVLFVSAAGEDDCNFKEDGVCDDGGPDPNTGLATSGLCPFGSDEKDCGARNAPAGAAYLKTQKDLEDEEAALNADDPAPATGQPYIPSYPGEPCFQQRSIHVSGRSPTTDLIAFSPKEWPVETHPVTKEERKTLQILQIGCELSQDDHAACYSDPNSFDVLSAKSNTKRCERRASTLALALPLPLPLPLSLPLSSTPNPGTSSSARVRASTTSARERS